MKVFQEIQDKKIWEERTKTAEQYFEAHPIPEGFSPKQGHTIIFPSLYIEAMLKTIRQWKIYSLNYAIDFYNCYKKLKDENND